LSVCFTALTKPDSPLGDDAAESGGEDTALGEARTTGVVGTDEPTCTPAREETDTVSAVGGVVRESAFRTGWPGTCGAGAGAGVGLAVGGRWRSGVPPTGLRMPFRLVVELTAG
jgi:hypothetical protein